MITLSTLRRVALVLALSGVVASCGSSDSRDRNVGTTLLCAQGGPCEVGEVGPAGGLVVVGANSPDTDMWEVAPLNGYGTYEDAVALVEDLEFGGATDWELPNEAVVDSINGILAGFACAADTDCASEFGSGTYWSADTKDGEPIVFSVGDESTVQPAVAGSTHFIRPVRTFRMTDPENSNVEIEVSGPETTQPTEEGTTSTSTSTTLPATTTTTAITTTTVSTTVPPTIPPADRINTIDAKWLNTCLLMADTRVKCRGYNQNGELGRGGFGGNGPTGYVLATTGAGELRGAVQISVGQFHVCAVMSNGSLVCWGKNEYGQLGVGDRDNRSRPAMVSGIDGSTADSTAIAVAAGGSHTCAVMESGRVKCWGWNKYGQLGRGERTTEFALTPSNVVGFDSPTGGPSASGISAGFYSTCAIASNGGLWCWGVNSNGGLGLGDTSMKIQPTAVPAFDGSADGKKVVTIEMSQYSACAINAERALFCWGNNENGALGVGDKSQRSLPAAVRFDVSAGVGVVDVAINSGMCATLSNGEVWCAGWNGDGRLGTGKAADSVVPLKVDKVAGQTREMSSIGITSGGTYACSLESSRVTVICWGSNEQGAAGFQGSWTRNPKITE